MAANINRVVISGNLTKDPELRTLPSGFSICSMRIATNTRKKEGESWVDKPNYFDVTVFGRLGETCNQYLSKGRGVLVDGRLEWREWTTNEGQKRQAVEIVAENVEFKGGGQGGNGNGGGQSDASYSSAPAQDAAPAPADDDIPF